MRACLNKGALVLKVASRLRLDAGFCVIGLRAT